MEVASFLGAVAAALGVVWAIAAAYYASFKRDEVRGWASSCIEVLQSISIICSTSPDRIPNRDERLIELAIRASNLLEIGRLYFSNSKRGTFSSEPSSPPAYRGYRPAILDEVFIAYQVAMQFGELSPADQQLAKKIVKVAERRFVSLAQVEVGRARSASRYNEVPGDGLKLDNLIDEARSTGRFRRMKLDF